MNPLWRKVLQPLRHSVRIKGFLYRCIWLLPERFRSQALIRGALKELADRQGGNVTFVNIGANDGLSGDHLREFIIRKRWRGLLVEPVPFVFDRLRRAYRGVDTVQFEQAAIAAQDGTTPFWFLQKNNTLAPGYDQIGSFSRDYLLHHAGMFPGLEPFITSMAVPSLTLASLLRKHAMSQLDSCLSMPRVTMARSSNRSISASHRAWSSSRTPGCPPPSARNATNSWPARAIGLPMTAAIPSPPTPRKRASAGGAAAMRLQALPDL